MGLRASMYLERRRGATPVASASHLFQLGVALDEFLRAAAGETDGETPVLIVALNPDDRADTEVRVANLLAQKRVRVGAASRGRPRVRARSGGPARRRRRNRLTSHSAEEFLGRVGVFRVGLIASRLPDLRHGAAYCLHQLAGNFGKESRRQRS